MKTDPRYLLVNLYQTILKVRLWKMIVTIFKLGSSLMHPVRMCCTRITIFKHGRYSYQSNAFIQHGRFDLLLDKTTQTASKTTTSIASIEQTWSSNYRFTLQVKYWPMVLHMVIHSWRRNRCFKYQMLNEAQLN